MNAIYSARCIDCPPELRELTMLNGTLNFNMSLAHNHNQSTGHTCHVLEEPKSVFVNQREIKIISDNRRIIKTFMS